MKFIQKSLVAVSAATIFVISSTSAVALDVKITQDLESVPVHHGAEFIKIQRIQDQNNVLVGGFTKTSRKCPPFCIQPLHVAAGVTTVAELELLEFIDKRLEVGKGILIDARTPAWFQKGTIPGAVNIPFTNFDPDNSPEELAVALKRLKVKKKEGNTKSFVDTILGWFSDDAKAADSPWDFTEAQDILLFCNGMWCGQSPTAIKNLLALGYPAEKIYYYRGGMQAWQSLGMTVYKP
ncbi:MAG: rhodanese-like domain-containing protein [Gammaproteobacteria bacterium]|jgi:rhodanese-related sulfurtransferase